MAEARGGSRKDSCEPKVLTQSSNQPIEVTKLNIKRYYLLTLRGALLTFTSFYAGIAFHRANRAALP